MVEDTSAALLLSEASFTGADGVLSHFSRERERDRERQSPQAIKTKDQYSEDWPVFAYITSTILVLSPAEF